MQPICNGNNIALVSADCDEVRCDCCDPCCADGQECHYLKLASNLDPQWDKLDDGRQFFQFSNDDTVSDQYQIMDGVALEARKAHNTP
jgi:hypothetical protein